MHMNVFLNLLAQTSSYCYCPRLGSLCRVRVRLKADAHEAETSVAVEGHEKLPDLSVTPEPAFPRCQDSVLQVPLGDWTTLRLGEGQCDITEACVEGMRAGEKCEVGIKSVHPYPYPSRAEFSVILVIIFKHCNSLR